MTQCKEKGLKKGLQPSTYQKQDILKIFTEFETEVLLERCQTLF